MSVSSSVGSQINAAEAFELKCETSGGIGSYKYHWTSNCTGECFVNGLTSQSVTRNAAHSIDSGSYTCNVTDSVGNIGNSSIFTRVKGKNLTFTGFDF